MKTFVNCFQGTLGIILALALASYLFDIREEYKEKAAVAAQMKRSEKSAADAEIQHTKLVGCQSRLDMNTAAEKHLEDCWIRAYTK